MSKKKDKKEHSDFIVDKVIWTVLNPILKPITYLNDILWPNYKITQQLFNGIELCYCGSREIYKKCCLTKNQKEGKKAIRIIKTTSKGQKEKIKLVKNPKQISKLFGRRGSYSSYIYADTSDFDCGGYDTDGCD